MRHQIMIYQDDLWTTLELNDRVQTESQAKKNIRAGTWKVTNKSSNDQIFKIVKSDQLLKHWEWEPGGILVIGEKSTSQGSHKEGEDPYFQPLITLAGVKRLTDGKFEVPSGSEKGNGKLHYSADPMKAGAIKWLVVRYEA